MSDESLPELRQLLALERERAAVPEGAEARVARRLSETLGVTLAAAGVASATTSGATALLEPGVRVLTQATSLAGKALVTKLLVAGLIGGVGIGGAVAVATWASRPPKAPVEGPAPPRVAPSLIGARGLPAKEESAGPLAAAPLAAAVSAAKATSPLPLAVPAPHHSARGRLGAERSLLGAARVALQGDNGRRALAILDQHARRFPHGQLSEERDALRVSALVATGDRAGARRWAKEFGRRHPNSLFLPFVAHAVTESGTLGQ